MAANARCALSCAGENRRRERRLLLLARRATPDSFRRAFLRGFWRPLVEVCAPPVEVRAPPVDVRARVDVGDAAVGDTVTVVVMAPVCTPRLRGFSP
jgi:hypothetical protein